MFFFIKYNLTSTKRHLYDEKINILNFLIFNQDSKKRRKKMVLKICHQAENKSKLRL